MNEGAPTVAQMEKNPPAMQEIKAQSLGREGPPEEGMATLSSVLAWRIPWTEEPEGTGHGVAKGQTGRSDSHTAASGKPEDCVREVFKRPPRAEEMGRVKSELPWALPPGSWSRPRTLPQRQRPHPSASSAHSNPFSQLETMKFTPSISYFWCKVSTSQ